MTRRTLTFIAAAALALCLCLPAAAELPYTISEVSENYGSGGYCVDGGKLNRGFIEDFEFLTTTRPGTELFLPLRAKDFLWDKDDDVQRPTQLTPAMMSQLRLSIDYEYIEGAEAIGAIELTARDEEIGILLRFKEAHHDIEPLEFHAEARLMQGGAPISGSDFVIQGQIANRAKNVYSTTTVVQLGVGRIAAGFHDVSGVRFDLGEGVTLTGDILFGQSLYGAAEAFAPDRELQKQHPRLSKGLRLYTVNMTGRVRIDTGDNGIMHVYDGELNYLGTTAGPLRQEKVYYLSPGKL